MSKILGSNVLVGVFAIVLSLAVSIASVQAGLLDPVLDPIQAEWDRFTDRVENELDNTPIGRELNRIVDDVEAVARIVEQFEGLITLASSAVPAVALVNLAIQYGHDPESLIPRFNERVETIQAQHPGVVLSEVEAAAILQSVLEEPPMPDGVYLGDGCIIDFSQCRDESTNPNPLFRAYYWDYSCYVEGVVDKKVIPTPQNANQRRAMCTASWSNMWSNGQHASSQFPASSQYATYDWQRCARVYLTQAEQDQFLARRSSVCQQPIAQHDVGEVCAVDYRSCSYGSYGNYNANRVGTITYGDVINQNFQHRREYACEVTYGTFALKSQLRDSCATVYVGDREVAEFIAANPEPVQQVPVPPQQAPAQPAQQPNTAAANVTLPSQRSLGVPTTLRGVFTAPVAQAAPIAPIHRLEEVAVVSPPPATEVFGRTGIVNIAPDISKKKTTSLKKVKEFTESKSKFNIQALQNQIKGQPLPSPLDSIFGNEQIHISVDQKSGDPILGCISIQGGIIKDVTSCNSDSSDSFVPTLRVQTSQTVLEGISNVTDLTAAIDSGEINYQAVGVVNKVKFGISRILAKIFG